MEAGFNNLSNFNEQFLRIKAMSPHAYRHAARLAGAAGEE